MTFKFKVRRNETSIGLPSLPRTGTREQPEQLTGSVQDMQASAPEERFAKALDKANIQYRFRYVAGAPKGLPGWKELDFVVFTKGLVYLVEVDTAFTHRGQASEDILHDAILLNDPELQMAGEIWPTVFHADGDSELADSTNAEQYVKRTFKNG